MRKIVPLFDLRNIYTRGTLIVLLSVVFFSFQNCVTSGNFDPASPSENSRPMVRGRTSKANSEIHIYFNATCSGDAIVSTTADNDGWFSVPVPMPQGKTTEVYADDTAVSADPKANCFKIGSYTHVVPAPPDSDQDGVIDVTDNCVQTPNPDQADLDSDRIGNVCDDDYKAQVFTILNLLDEEN